MRRHPLSRALAVLAISSGLAACGSSSNLLTTPVSPANAYLLTSNNRIIGVDLDDLEFARSVVPVAQATDSTPVAGALDQGESILDVDFRNAEGTLYALTRKGSEGRIIRIDPRSGAIARVSTLTADLADTTAPFAGLVTDIRYTIDFNPVVDRLRVIGSDGSNLRVDALTGETFTDGSITPAGNTVAGVAYRDDFNLTPGAGRGTTLFSIAQTSGGNAKVFPTNANAGVLNDADARELGLSATDLVAAYDVNPLNNRGIAVVKGSTGTRVFNIDPAATSGSAASPMGTLPALPGTETYTGLALVTSANPTVTALTRSNALVTFRALEPFLTSNPVTVTVESGDALVGIDFRQSDRVLYGLGRSGKAYNLTDPANPIISTSSGALSGPQDYTLDFNPASTANKLRLIDTLGNNAVIDIDLATRGEKPMITASTTVAPVVAGLAYTNNFRGSTSTQLLAIDRANSTLNLIAITAPTAPATTPAEGALTPVTALGITLDPASPVGFDISGHGNDNQLLMARTSNAGNFTLYRLLSASTGSPLATLGEINGSSNYLDIAIRF